MSMNQNTKETAFLTYQQDMTIFGDITSPFENILVFGICGNNT